MKVNWERSKALSGWMVAFILMFSLVGIVIAFNPGYQTIIQQGSMVSSDDFIISTDGTNYFARNGLTGSVDSSDTSASVVIQYSLNHLPVSSLWGSRIGSIRFLTGNYSITTTIIINVGVFISSGPGVVLYSVSTTPIFNATVSGGSMNGLALVVSPGGDGIVLYHSSSWLFKNIFISSRPGTWGTIIGTGAGFRGYGPIANTFENVFIGGIWDGYNFTYHAGLAPNFNHWYAGQLQLDKHGIYIFRGEGNTIDSVLFEPVYIGVILVRTFHNIIENSWFEDITNYSIIIGQDNYFAFDSRANIITGSYFTSNSAGVWDNGYGTQIDNNVFLHDPKIVVGTQMILSNYNHNSDYNPFGKISTPFGHEFNTYTVGMCGANCSSSPTASIAYFISGMDIFVNSTGGIGISISIIDGHGHTIITSLTTLSNYFIPVGFEINFGAFSVAPTVYIYGT